jgi:DNA-binding response OmpR family regulator
MNATNETLPRILLAEDEALLALLLAERLEQAGFRIAGPATSVAAALALIEQEGCDAAVLDIQLGNETAAPVVHALRDRNIPYLTLSGYSETQRLPVFEDAPMLVKPVRMHDLVACLKRCLAQKA